MTRRGIATILGPLLVALLICVNAPAVSADPPCILDNAGNCAAAGRDFTEQQIVAFDALSVSAPGVTAASGGPEEGDQIRTALEMASAATIAPIAATLSGPASAPSERTASAAWSK